MYALPQPNACSATLYIALHILCCYHSLYWDVIFAIFDYYRTHYFMMRNIDNTWHSSVNIVITYILLILIYLKHVWVDMIVWFTKKKEVKLIKKHASIRALYSQPRFISRFGRKTSGAEFVWYSVYLYLFMSLLWLEKAMQKQCM